jgi:hypothetical protein
MIFPRRPSPNGVDRARVRSEISLLSAERGI